MRRIVPILLCAVALVMAGGSWIGPSMTGPAANAGQPNNLPKVDKPRTEEPAKILKRACTDQALVGDLSVSPVRRLVKDVILEPKDATTETLHFDGPNYTGVGLSAGGTFWGAVRFTPMTSCTLKAVLFYQYAAAQNGYAYIFDAGSNTSPGAVLESVPYTGAGTGWKRIDLPTPLYRTSGVDFWSGVKTTHSAAVYPLGVDYVIPGVYQRGCWITTDRATWYDYTGSFGNWNQRVVVAAMPYADDMAAISIDSLTSPKQPNQWLTLKTTVKNIGSNTRSPGIPVILHITGPSAYNYWDTVSTSTTLAPNATEMLTYSPNWRTPATLGNYVLTVWTNYAGDMNRANDTVRYTLEVSNWITYADWNTSAWYTWAAPEKGTIFQPNDFGLSYPVRIDSLKAGFWRGSHVWRDSSFRFKVFGNDGATRLYISNWLEAVPPSGGGQVTVKHGLSSPVTVTSGVFFATVDCAGDSGYPDMLADGNFEYRSVFGDSTQWYYWDLGEFYVSAYVTWTAPVNDVGFFNLYAPYMYVEPSVPVSPRGVVRNYGTAGQTNVACSCYVVDTTTDARVYSGAAAVSSIAAGDTAPVTFPAWTPPSGNNVYEVQMATFLTGDGNRSNDSIFHTFMGFHVVDPLVAPFESVLVTVDGNIQTAEWADANKYDISNILGTSDPYYRYFPNNAWLYLKHDSARLHLAADISFLTQNDSTEIGLYFDENNDGAWAADSSEGNYWATHRPNASPIDSIFYRGITATDVWRTLATGSTSRTSMTSGHMQFEMSIPIGTAKAALNANGGGDTLGFYCFVMDELYGYWPGWWKTTMSDDSWRSPNAYGTLVLAGHGGAPPGPDTWPKGWREVAGVPSAPSGKQVKDGGWVAFQDGEDHIYAAKGNKTGDFYSYNPVTDAWTPHALLPDGSEAKKPYKGACGIADGNGHVYATKGNNTVGFWRYTALGDSWAQYPDVLLGGGKKVKGGSDMEYVVLNDTGYVYFLKGYKNEFYRFNTLSKTWQTLPAAPGDKWDKGSFLVFDKDHTVYAHQAKYNLLASFNVTTGAWNTGTLKGMPFIGRTGKSKKSKDGGSGAWFNGAIYALKGGNTQEFWRYIAAGDSWTELDTIPAMGSTGKKKKIKAGADIVNYPPYEDGALFALKGNKTYEFWRYVVAPAFGGGQGDGVAAGKGRERPFVSLAPNPLASGLAALRYSLPTAGPVNLSVYDATGRKVIGRSLVLSRRGATSLDLRSLSAGVYLVRVEATGFSASQKLVVQH